MSTDPDQIRGQVAALLAELPDIAALGESAALDAAALGDAFDDTVLEELSAGLAQAHDVLVSALESVEKG